MPAANHDKAYALRLYLWNAALCECLYLPLQTAEVCVRNAIHGVLTKRFGPDWCTNDALLNLLPQKYRYEVTQTAASEKVARGAAYTTDHVVAGLSFGFWTTLFAKSYNNHFWHGGMHDAFPFAPASLDREKAYIKVNRLRTFRNKVAHHYAIFDKQPLDEHLNGLHIIGWSSPAAVGVVKNLCNPREVAQKPKRWPTF